MELLTNPLSFIILLPAFFGLAIFIVPRDNAALLKKFALLASLAVFAVSLKLWTGFDPAQPAMQFGLDKPWLPSYGINFSIGLDGISLLMVLLTTFLLPVSVLASFSYIKENQRAYYACLLFLEAGMIGVFAALDLFVFYLFWEAMLIPMYFLIGIWGGPRRVYAALKFFIYTMAGSVLMLAAILWLAAGHHAAAGAWTFSIPALYGTLLPHNVQLWLFAAFALAFAVKVPLFPFHTWLPDAHVEAPTAGSVILAGVLLKMGVYGLLRISFSILPAGYEWFLPYLAAIAFINIVYGALCAMAQTDMKKMVAYSSINHMGYCLLGMVAVSATGFNGAVLQMINHGIITGALFFLVGVIYDRAHTRDITAFGGLGARVPVYAALMAMTCFASLGLPGLAGFVSEFLCFLGAFDKWKLFTILSVSGILVTAAFFLRMLQKVFLGPLNEKWKDLSDMDLRELVSVVPLAVLMLVFGIWPRFVLDLMNPTMTYMAKMFPGMFSLVR